ncbi:Isochorismatase-like protein [Phaeosphaeriaceae sp. PMI808]|nr:Isochorismatase-like protein [Phaeosphaeriaceae sp. PMI808]
MFISKLSLLACGFSVAVQSISVTPPNYARQIQSQAPQADWVPWERINRNDSALLIIDHQVGLFQLARDWDGTLFKQNIMAHATMAKLFDIPVVMTSSAATGPNGPVLKEFTDLFPSAPYIKRTGEVNAWDNPEFRAAVKATGKKQFIIAGIVTDVCTAFVGLSLRSEGYSVFANVEASGTTTELIRDTANLRMQAAGVHLMSSFAILADLMRDWRTTSPAVSDVVHYVDTYLPAYGMLVRGHASAILHNGTVLPGAETLI